MKMYVSERGEIWRLNNSYAVDACIHIIHCCMEIIYLLCSEIQNYILAYYYAEKLRSAAECMTVVTHVYKNIISYSSRMLNQPGIIALYWGCGNKIH